MSDFRTEFPDYSPSTMPPLPAGFVDTSWHNDACPCWTNEKLHLVVFTDYANAEDRETPEMSRFTVHSINADGDISTTLLETNDWAEALDFLHRYGAVQ